MVTTVTMAHPVSSLGQSEKLRIHNSDSLPGFRVLVGGIVFACLPVSTLAAEWDATARLHLSEIYTDNLRLAVDDEEHESITQINPGFSLTGRGARVRVGADYTMQNLFYAHNPDSNTTHHQLRAWEQSELIKDWFYFDSSASISQQLVSPSERVSVDNLNLTGNRSDVVTFQVEPYIKRDLGAYATTELRYSHGWVDYEADGVSDTQSSTASGYIANGYGATHLFWRLAHREQREIRDDAADSTRSSTTGMMRYRVLSTLSLIGYAGREENDIQSNRPSPDGTYWSAGFRWHPSPKLSLEATKGRNEEQAHLQWSPITRTAIDISYRDRDVGLNTSETWNGTLSHRTRRSTWALSYTEEVTNDQFLALQGQEAGFLVDSQGQVSSDPNTGEPAIGFRDVFGLSNQEFLRTRAQLSMNYRSGKSTVSLSVYDETRTYELSAAELETKGGSASWNWRFAARTSSRISVQGQRYEALNSSDPGQTVKTSLSLARQLSPRTNARVEVSHLDGEEVGTQAKYDENRVSLHLNMNF